MPTVSDAVDVYRKLAEEHNRLNHPQERDRFLLLAADAAQSAGQREEAERFRKSILSQNPNHLLKPYASLDEALKSSDILAYVQQLRRSYPQDKAAIMLESLKKSAPAPTTLPPAPSKEPDAEDDLILPLDVGSSKPANKFAMDPPAPKKPIRLKEANMSGTPQQPKPNASPVPPWQSAGTASSPPASSGGPGIFGLRPEPAPLPRPALTPLPPAPKPVEEDEPETTGAFHLFMCVGVVLAGLALLIFTFGAPFVPWW